MGGRALFVLLACLALEAHGQAVSAGRSHSLALSRSGQVFAWGSDRVGQLGVGSVAYRKAPARIAGLPEVRMVASGSSPLNAAVSTAGEVWIWGQTSSDQELFGSVVPTRVEGLSDVVQVAVGHAHFAALKRDGSVWTWGHSSLLGLGYPTGTGFRFLSQPRRVDLLPPAVAIAAGADSTIALAADGNAWFVGATGSSGSSGLHRIDVSDVVGIAAGKFFSFALVLKRDGTVWGVGDDYEGQLGDGGPPGERTVPVQVRGLPRVRAISAGMKHAAAIAEDGSVWTWGNNDTGQLGTGGFSASTTAVRVAGLPVGVSVDAGVGHTLVVDADGGVWGWGIDVTNAGSEGLRSAVPVRIPTGERVKQVQAGDGFSAAVTTSGAVLAWGSRLDGVLGDGSVFQRSTPTAVASLPPISAIAGGYLQSFAIARDGTVWAWGRNTFGELGDGTFQDHRSPQRVPALDGVVQVSSSFHGLALRANGTVLAWGSNSFGELGNGTNGSAGGPIPVPGLSDVVAVAAGNGFSMALRRDGTVFTWGWNLRGQLGDGTTTSRSVPAAVPNLRDVVAISTSTGGGTEMHAMALKRDGTVWTWGSNHAGQLGDGTLTPRLVPGIVPDLTDVVAISGGFIHSLALKRDGTVWAWGSNAFAQLGIGTNVHATRPTRVEGIDSVAAIFAAVEHSAAVKSDGTVWAWGRNDSGQVGDGSFAHRLSPAVVLSVDGRGTIPANDWFLRLDDRVVPRIPDDRIPKFLLLASGAQTDVKATIRFRPEDVGRDGRVFVFALAPASIVKRAADAKDGPAACVLAQLSRSGELLQTSPANLQAFLSGVLSADGAAVSVLNGVPASSVAGATFFVGYGSDGASMINGGTNRSALALDGPVRCSPQPPQTGWWWNPAEDGRGFSIEARGNNLFFASFLYDVSGRSTWYVSSGPSSLDGSYYSGDLLAAHGGQTLAGPYRGFPALERVGNVTLAFNAADQGTMVWPGGVVPLQRFDIVPNGRALPAAAGQPESGWWWNEAEAGRGFFMEWQGGNLDIAGYMYDDAGNPVWYLTVGPIGGAPAARSFGGSWWSYANGQTLTGAWKPNSRTSTNVAALTITFTGADTALMTLPNGRTTSLRRHRF